MRATFVVQLHKKPEALERVAGLLRRRGFSIQSLTMGEDEERDRSRITIQVEADEARLRVLEANLEGTQRLTRAECHSSTVFDSGTSHHQGRCLRG